MEKLKALGKKAAPWLAVFAGGMVAGVLLHRKFTAPGPPPTPTT